MSGALNEQAHADIPVLAIVGHPNKGKSSIVSTLAQDTSVRISPLSGTTAHSRVFPIRVDGEELCRLVDTPGFQRPRAAMDWMQRQSRSAADHQDTVRRFVDKHRDDPRFAAECDLLVPILDGAGILYVIDGSVPYGPDYDAEMEILRWTGGPSMALINRIGEDDHVESWRPPLSQYFRIVREFHALNEPFERQVQLLTGFAELRESWREPLGRAADSLVARRKQQIDQATSRIVELLASMLGASETLPLAARDDRAGMAKGVKRLEARLGELEQDERRDVERLFNHAAIERDETGLPAMDDDLFAEESWQLFGLSRDQVLAMGAVGGAATGALVDVGTGGLSMFLGSGLGAVLGAAGAWFGSRQLVGTRVMGLPLGGHAVVVGPVTNIHFPWVILGRAVTHLRLVSHRNHAIRDRLRVEHGAGKSPVDDLEQGKRRELQGIFNHLSRGRSITTAERRVLEEAIAGLVEAPAAEASESQ